ncbi:hypothetical protein QBC44DRAFT_384058 [Cladorrhinum sp. PSN332]|nr:hypothetical protein QBC44DRAFT_384058 [Cladorrhinum sp. PSN332]
MEPLSALGIAAAVVQFLDYASKKCRTVQQLYNAGEGVLFKELAFERIADDFVEFSTLLRSRSRFGSHENDEAIDAIVDNCVGVAQRLSGIFNKLAHVRQGADQNIARKVIALMKAAWKSDDIAFEMEQLAAYQRQLSLRMLYHLNATTEASGVAQESRLAAFESRIVEVMAISDNKLESILRQGAALRRRLDESETRGIMEGENTVTVALKLENGDTKFLKPPGNDSRPLDTRGQVLMTLKSDFGSRPASAQVQDFMPIQHAVLESLFFRRYSDRYEGLKTAHARTYEWIYEPPGRENPQQEVQWSPLLPWLESGRGCYWVNGKAGSGKSTLMKFIAEHKETQAALQRWVSGTGHDLIQASFFFWNLGTDLQKSRTGLLRALLYDILRARPQLISIVMPELWMALAGSEATLDSPSDSELVKWFHRLLEQASNNSRLFFLIDGIDEYEGDHIDLANTITGASANPNVKFLISSRPLPSCVYSFSHFASLKLQDLTRGDIRQFAEDCLKAELEQRYGESMWDEVVTQIVDKSFGVFLWVVLVVRSLLVGLHNWDSFEELLLRLEELPSDLKDLYAHMLRRLAPEYRHQASEAFQLCLLALDKQNDPRLFPPRQLHFAQANMYDEEKMKVLPYSEEEEARLCKAVEGRLRSRCYGLVELKSAKAEMKNYAETTLQQVSVEFIHRSAVEFLRLPDVFRGLLSLTEGTSFNPVLQMFRSCLLLCKTLEEKVGPSESLVRFYTYSAMEYASLAEEAGTPVPAKHLEELDKTFTVHLRRSFSAAATTYNKYWDYSAPSRRQELLEPGSLHSIALQCGLVTFFRESPAKSDVEQTAWGANNQASRLLYDGINSLLFLKPWPRGKGAVLGPRCAAICNILLTQGADPNAKFTASYKAAWDLMLEFASHSAQHKKAFHADFRQQGAAYLYSRLLIPFLKNGADPNSIVAWPASESFGPDEQANPSTYFSVLKAFDFLYSEFREPGDPLDQWTPGSNNKASVYPKEVKDFHGYIIRLIQERGGKARFYVKGGLNIGKPAQLPNASSSSLLGLSQHSSSSTSSMASKFSFKKIGEAISSLMKQ